MKLSSKDVAPANTPINIHFFLSIPLPDCVSLFCQYNCKNGISLFWCAFFLNEWVWASFHMFIDHLHFLFYKLPICSFLIFFNWVIILFHQFELFTGHEYDYANIFPGLPFYFVHGIFCHGEIFNLTKAWMRCSSSLAERLVGIIRLHLSGAKAQR